jgi:hypothetical protein
MKALLPEEQYGRRLVIYNLMMLTYYNTLLSLALLPVGKSRVQRIYE